MKPEIRYCTAADGTRIAYATGDEGPPLVLSPAWGSNLEIMWGQSIFQDWFGLGRTAVGYDRRGIGSSQREVNDFTLAAHVSDLAAVVEAIGPSPCELAGSFDSSGVVIAYAAQYPERVSRLMLSAAYSRGDEIGGPANARGLKEIALGNWGLFRRAMRTLSFREAPQNRRSGMQIFCVTLCRRKRPRITSTSRPP